MIVLPDSDLAMPHTDVRVTALHQVGPWTASPNSSEASLASPTATTCPPRRRPISLRLNQKTNIHVIRTESGRNLSGIRGQTEGLLETGGDRPGCHYSDFCAAVPFNPPGRLDKCG
ncbi:hypothetical protein GCM10029978_066930 [Actinoallomurus acanthiterrae]